MAKYNYNSESSVKESKSRRTREFSALRHILLSGVTGLLAAISAIGFFYLLISNGKISYFWAISFAVFTSAFATITTFTIKRFSKNRTWGDLEISVDTNIEKEIELLNKSFRKSPDNIDSLEKLSNLYEKSGMKEKARDIDNRIFQINRVKKFENNLNKKIILNDLELNSLYFFDNFRWTLQPQVNILLGRNGYGKSYLLRLMVALLQEEKDKSREFFKHSRGDNVYTGIWLHRDGEPGLICRNDIIFEKSVGKIPILALPDNRTLDKSQTDIEVTGDDKNDLKEHGAYHFLFQKPYNNLIEVFLYQLCITYLEEGKRFDLPVFQLLHKVIRELTDDEFAFHKIESVGQARFRIEVLTEGNDEPLPIQQASQGTLSILAIFGKIYEYLETIFPNVPAQDVSIQPGIVFIDELDVHLHPAWQQKVVRLLKESFPNVQFFVSAHSPLVIAGCKEGEVAVLRKEKNGFEVRCFNESFIGCEAKELYEKVFNIEEKDEAYLKYIAMVPLKGEIKEKIRRLDEKQQTSNLTKKEKKQKEQLYDDLYYLEKADEKYMQRREYSKLSIENRKLKRKIKKLEAITTLSDGKHDGHQAD